MIARRPAASFVGSRHVAAVETAVPRVGGRWVQRAHGIYRRAEESERDCTVAEDAAVERDAPVEQGGDKFMRILDEILSAPRPVSDAGIVWTTARGERVWEPVAEYTHCGMAAAAIPRATWADSPEDATVWCRPYECAPRWLVRGGREYEARVRPAPSGGCRQAPTCGPRAGPGGEVPQTEMPPWWRIGGREPSGPIALQQSHLRDQKGE